jgi:SAM-dependent methyltransferase
LKKHGLKPDSKLLDVGCGSLRLGVKVIPFLEKGNYYGIDCDKEMVTAGLNNELSQDVRQQKNPLFAINKNFDLSSFGQIKFDMAMAQSVWTHITPPGIELCMKNVVESLKPGGVFLASYNLAENNMPAFGKPYPVMTKYPVDFFDTLACKYNLDMVNIGNWGIEQNNRKEQLMLMFRKR